MATADAHPDWDPDRDSWADVPAAVAWNEFHVRLEQVLGEMEPGDRLILAVRRPVPDGSGLANTNYFVQFAADGEAGFRAEATSNSFLPPEHRLDAERQREMVLLGWQVPTYGPGVDEDAQPEGSSPNWYRDYDGATEPPHGEIAALAISTLHGMFGTATPEELAYRAFNEEGDTSEPLLCLEQLTEERSPQLDAEAALLTPASRDELVAAMAETLRATSGTTPVTDDDGDFPFQVGSTMVYLRAADEAPVVQVFAPLLADVDPSLELLAALNEINSTHRLVRVSLNGSLVMLSIDVLCHPYVGAHVLGALDVLSSAADHLDDELQSRFGGRRYVDDAKPRSGTRAGTGGYL